MWFYEVMAKEVRKMWKRITAFLIDHVIICFLFTLLGMIGMLVRIDFELLMKMYYIFLLAFMLIYFFKDIVNGQSIGKERLGDRIAKTKVVER